MLSTRLAIMFHKIVDFQHFAVDSETQFCAKIFSFNPGSKITRNK